MARQLVLFSGQWADLPLEELTAKAAEWGYQGLELACWGDHLDVQLALSEEEHCSRVQDLFSRHELQLPAIAAHKVSQAVCDRIEPKHQSVLPEHVWADGSPEKIQKRAVEEMLATVRVAEKLGVTVITGFSGSLLWPNLLGYPAPSLKDVGESFRDFAKRWKPILDACGDAGIRYALEVHPGQIAFDLFTADMALDAVEGREELGFTFDPSHLHWQGIDPVEFLRKFPDRIYHVHIKDVSVSLNGRTSLLGSYLPYGDARRGWDFRSPGRGGIDWEAVIRGLNAIGYAGPLSVEWKDAGMDREAGVQEACKFVQRLNFTPATPTGESAFLDEKK